MKLWHILILVMLTSCAAQDSQYLVGRWSFDPLRTLAELKTRKNAPSSLISCYEKQVCGYFIEIEYTPTTWQSIFTKGDIEPMKPTTYVATVNGKSEILVNTKESDKEVEYTVVKLSDDSMYIEVGSNDFKWKEYFKRKK